MVNINKILISNFMNLLEELIKDLGYTQHKLNYEILGDDIINLTNSETFKINEFNNIVKNKLISIYDEYKNSYNIRKLMLDLTKYTRETLKITQNSFNNNLFCIQFNNFNLAKCIIPIVTRIRLICDELMKILVKDIYDKLMKYATLMDDINVKLKKSTSKLSGIFGVTNNTYKTCLKTSTIYWFTCYDRLSNGLFVRRSINVHFGINYSTEKYMQLFNLLGFSKIHSNYFYVTYFENGYHREYTYSDSVECHAEYNNYDYKKTDKENLVEINLIKINNILDYLEKYICPFEKDIIDILNNTNIYDPEMIMNAVNKIESMGYISNDIINMSCVKPIQIKNDKELNKDEQSNIITEHNNVCPQVHQTHYAEATILNEQSNVSIEHNNVCHQVHPIHYAEATILDEQSNVTIEHNSICMPVQPIHYAEATRLIEQEQQFLCTDVHII